MCKWSISILVALFWFANTQNTTSSCEELVNVTFYGFPDNSPPGTGIECKLDSKAQCSTSQCYSRNSSALIQASDCGPRGETAGGTGAYDDPLTMASSGQWFCYQEVVYLPYLQKYLRYEDFCLQCTKDAALGIRHIDIWTGTDINGGTTQIGCENSLTPSNSMIMIRNPPLDLPVNRKFSRQSPTRPNEVWMLIVLSFKLVYSSFQEFKCSL
jgi:hypothetical protein